MSTPKLIVAAVALCLAGTTACGSKQKKVEATTAGPSRVTGGGAATAAKKEAVDGELADAILKLRRIHFAYDTSTLAPDVRADLADAGEKLSRYPNVHIYIEGYTDERGTSEYNIALGERRAQAVVDYLVRMGVSPDRLHVVSFGEERPMDDGTTVVANARNRRVDFRLMRGDVQLVVEEGLLLDDHGNPLSGNGSVKAKKRKDVTKHKSGASMSNR